MALDYAGIAKSIVACVGRENIRSVAHCATRLRLIVADRSKIDDEAVGDIEGVKGVFFNAGQYQIILGTGVVDRVYDETVKLGISETSGEEAEEAKMDGKNAFQRAIRTFGDVFVPVIPILVATGLFLGLKGALLNDNFLGLFGLTTAAIPSSFNLLVTVLTDTTFSFLPAIICWSAFRVFGGTPAIGLVLGLMLVNGALPNAYSVADPSSGVTPVYLFDFIPIVGYQGSILPAFVAGFLGSHLEKFFRKRMPTTLDFMMTPFLTLLIMMLVSLCVIGPILHGFENVLLSVVEAGLQLPFGLGGLIVGFFWSMITLRPLGNRVCPSRHRRARPLRRPSPLQRQALPAELLHQRHRWHGRHDPGPAGHRQWHHHDSGPAALHLLALPDRLLRCLRHRDLCHCLCAGLVLRRTQRGNGGVASSSLRRT